MMNRKTYKTDLTDAEWQRLEPLLPAPKTAGRPRLYTTREIINAIFCVTRSGCAWRLMPNDLPYWKTVYHYFRLWRPQTSEALIYVANSRLLLKRLVGT